MLRLVLFRHARAAPTQRGGSDHERPLDADGWREAEDTARGLKALGAAPDRVLCSDARRTCETHAACSRVWPDLPPAEPSRDLYGADPIELLDLLATGLDAEPVAWVIGHNPTMEQLVTALSGRYVGMGTAHAALLELDAETWADARGGTWRLVDIVTP